MFLPFSLSLRQTVRATALCLGTLASVGSALAASSSFGLAVLPDTQFYARYATAAEGNQFMNRYGNEPYDAQVRWLAQHARALGIPFVAHLGDVVDQSNRPAQWQVADAAMKKLEAAGLPYSILAGNHDVGSSNAYLNWFPTSRAAAKATFGGRDPSGWHEYHVFEAEGQRFMVMALSWSATREALAWARGVIAANPTLPVILTSHEYGGIDSDGITARDTAYGNYLWENLIRDNDQIFMVLSGHNHGAAHKVRTNAFGNPVHELLTDYQMAYQGGNGYMRLYEFDLTENRIRALTFSPWVPEKPEATRNTFDRAVLTEPNNEFDIAMDFRARFARFHGGFGPAEATREVPLRETVREMVLANYEDPVPPVTADVFDREDYVRNPRTVAHWRPLGVAGQPVADRGLIADTTGNNPLRRAPLAGGALLADAVWSADRHALSSAPGSVCFTANSNKGDVRQSFLTTAADAPMNNLTLRNGYTVEAFIKIDANWTPGNNAWMNILTRDGNRGNVPGYSGGDRESTPLLFAISSLREIQWEPTVLPNGGGATAKAAWSGEIMADQWTHVAIVNDPVTFATTMYVGGAPVLRNAVDAPGIAALPDQPWVFGAGRWDAARTDGFYGCIGEVRVTSAALEPSRWLTARKTRVVAEAARQPVNGTDGDDQIFLVAGAGAITTGTGADTIVLRNLREAGGAVADFTPGEDMLNLQPLLASLRIAVADPLATGHVRVIDSPAGALVQVDADGVQGPAAPRTVLTLRNVRAEDLRTASFLF